MANMRQPTVYPSPEEGMEPLDYSQGATDGSTRKLRLPSPRVPTQPKGSPMGGDDPLAQLIEMLGAKTAGDGSYVLSGGIGDGPNPLKTMGGARRIGGVK